MIKEQLLIAMQQQELIAIYNYASDETFSVGYVINIDSLFVTLKGIDMEGKLNGLSVIRIRSIKHVETQMDYLAGLEVKRQLAIQMDYYDLWNLDERLKHVTLNQTSALKAVVMQAMATGDSLVIGTRQFKDRDEFLGVVKMADNVHLKFNYLNLYDFSAVWEREVLFADIDYLRIWGSQTFQTNAIIEQLLN